MPGRPRKQTVDFFPHFSNSPSSRTLFIIENRFGNDGYAFWFKLLELLCRSENMYFRAGNANNWEYLLGLTRLDNEKAEAILTVLANLEAIDRQLWTESKIVWVEKLVANLGYIFEKRQAERPSKPIVSPEIPVSTPEIPVSTAESQFPPLEKRKEKNSRSKRSMSETKVSDAALRLAEKLKALILENNPSSKPANLTAWAIDFDKMMRLDKRTESQIEKVMEFSQHDDFWHVNILSAGKMREKYDQLYLKMERANGQHGINGQSSAWRGLPGNRPAGAFSDIPND